MISFLAILAILLVHWNKVFSFKYSEGMASMTIFGEQEENTIDAIIFGSSHVYQNINTAVLWNEYGIASYDLTGPLQPLWNTYYCMETALKTQVPKVMIVDMFTAVLETDYVNE